MRRSETIAARAAEALEPLLDRFTGKPALVFATGESLTKLWDAERSLPCPAIVVNDAWRIVPGADILHASDGCWWRHYAAVPTFQGLKTGVNDGSGLPRGVVELCVSGTAGFDPRLGWLRHGHNSGTASAHLAAQLGGNPIVLVGVDMQGEHFFGKHPQEVNRRSAPNFANWMRHFALLGEELAKIGVSILNATPGSAMDCFPMTDLDFLC